MISQATRVDTWAAVGRGSCSGGGGCLIALATMMASATKPAIQKT